MLVEQVFDRVKMLPPGQPLSSSADVTGARGGAPDPVMADQEQNSKGPLRSLVIGISSSWSTIRSPLGS